MILTTTNTIEGHKIHDYLGIVTGASAKLRKTSFSFNMEKFYETVEENMNEVKEDAFQNLKQNAINLKANAVVGIRVDFEINNTSQVILVSVTGTAVKVA
jgi:uncharacterized protein YbjQ (UPF0145 family)